MRWLVALLTLGLVSAACSSEPQVPIGVDIADGYTITVLAEGFIGPTQMVTTPDGDFVIAELNGAENDATGRVLLVDGDDWTKRTVLQRNLDKPTGVAVIGDALWIMQRDRLSVSALDPGAPLRIVADDLPSNGRSEGTLTVTPSGSLLYDTSGSKRGPDRVDGSATLFEITDADLDPSDPVAFATGFKHAYAHTFDESGQLWSVEMTDGNFDEVRASDELLAVNRGDDAGWPFCVDDHRPVVEYGGTPERCAETPASHALFGTGATPTSIVVAPWSDEFIVALWLPGKVVTVPLDPSPGDAYSGSDFIDGIESPQHLLVNGDHVLLSDHETGRIFAIKSNVKG